jgi:hypothetical protein
MHIIYCNKKKKYENENLNFINESSISIVTQSKPPINYPTFLKSNLKAVEILSIT